eukprot:gnl/MRDRNA2_/MRDRNA2_18010_c0_seq1.p1 gnl/MRDRNA2_/MRDRNA2_18010_c0~~gnl/MRDRNA2_/MRDRNA2_18010_c0_seq1.p1  ORF type:complete len:241 (+),score=53.52 gnl/MRDRNA2_/MRDRNA2_18010_c0_seq1:79-723(+)
MADKAFTASLIKGLLDAVMAAVSNLKDRLRASDIGLDKFTLALVRRLLEGASYRTQVEKLVEGVSRRLQARRLTVDYSVLIPLGVSSSPEALGAMLVSNKGMFESTMASSYVAAFKANTGAEPLGFTGLEASDTTGIKVVTVAPEDSAEPVTASTPASTLEPVDDLLKSTGASASADEADVSTGMVLGVAVGVILGAAALGGIFCIYKKRKAAQ